MKQIFTKLFSKPDVRTLAQQEYADAQRQLLAAQSAQEYATRMVQYHTDRAQRLGALLEGSAA